MCEIRWNTYRSFTVCNGTCSGNRLLKLSGEKQQIENIHSKTRCSLSTTMFVHVMRMGIETLVFLDNYLLLLSELIQTVIGRITRVFKLKISQ